MSATCWMVKEPTVDVVYVYPVMGGQHDLHAERFARTYREHPADYPHTLYVVANGGLPTKGMGQYFTGIDCKWLTHDDSGWEIGAYRMAAKKLSCDLLVCLGGSSRFVREGWLNRMVQAFNRHGLAIYGATANTGDVRVGVSPHIRTTGFWFAPVLLNQYPHVVTSERSSRYAFEHGPDSFTSWAVKRGVPAIQVNWDSESTWPEWANVTNSFHRGDQSQVIVFDRVCEPPYYSA